MPNRNDSGTRWVTLHACGLCLGIGLAVLAGDPHGTRRRKPAPVDRKVRPAVAESAWTTHRIRELGDPVYGVRAKATRQLIAAGGRTIDQLLEVLDHSDREIARRSRSILVHIIRNDEDGFCHLEGIAETPSHPQAGMAAEFIHNEMTRRQRVLAGLAAQRKKEALRLLREARAAIHSKKFTDARRKATEAQSLGVTYTLFEDNPDCVLNDIRQISARVTVPVSEPIRTAENDGSQIR